jgi:cbb3-type cytochrome oxidase subunit 1
MRGIAFWFFISAIAYLILGIVLGGVMAGSKDFTMAPVHGHLNLIGWLSFAIFGIYYHLDPRSIDSPLAKIHFALATLGLWMIVPGIALFELGITDILAAIGGLVTFASIVFFGFIVTKYRLS